MEIKKIDVTANTIGGYSKAVSDEKGKPIATISLGEFKAEKTIEMDDAKIPFHATNHIFVKNGILEVENPKDANCESDEPVPGEPYFTGIINATSPQGKDFDLTAGVKAFNADGNEIPFSVSPDFEKCEVGAQEFAYSAEGITEVRTITVTEIENPKVKGTSDVTIEIGEDFDPMAGVTATDGNGNEVAVSVSEPVNVQRELEYIEGHGKEYIDTGLKLNNNSRIVVDMQYTYPEDTKDGFRFTGDETASGKMFRFGTHSNRYWFPKYGAETKQITPPTGGGLLDRVTIDMDRNVFKINGNAQHEFSTSEFETGGNCYIFAINANSVIDLAVAKVYSYKLYDNDSLLLDLVPYNDSGEIGFRDRLTGTFYGNEGEGAFTGGEELTGTYDLEYTATDDCGNETTVVRKVTVEDYAPKPRTLVVASGANTALIMNVPPEKTYSNVLAEYPALGYGHDYVFENEDDVLWKEYKDKITQILFSSEVKPKSTAYWFANHTKLGLVANFAPLNLSECTNMAHMLDGCTSLTRSRGNLNNLGSVTDMSYLFRNCPFGGYALPNWDVSSVKNMDYMFDGCTAETLDLTGWNTESVESFENMFSNMANLKTIKVGDTFTLNGWSGDMFTGDTNLVGGAGTTYIDGSSEYARIDSEDNKGYFTKE